MEYSLALQLKNAGFAFEFCPDLGDPAHDPLGCEQQMPTLEELIEACGDAFYDLKRVSNISFRAEAKSGLIALGSTPTEAVARLWLALNQK